MLTASGLKSVYFYLSLIALVLGGAIYLLFFKQPDVIDNLNRQAFKLNHAAFANGVRLANLKFILSEDEESNLNRWQDNNSGLDFNAQGFPIGTDIQEEGLLMPASIKNCRQIWNFVLGPIKPLVLLNKGDTNTNDGQHYWTRIDDRGVCYYMPVKEIGLNMQYNASLGTVSLVNNQQNTVNYAQEMESKEDLH